MRTLELHRLLLISVLRPTFVEFSWRVEGRLSAGSY